MQICCIGIGRLDDLFLVRMFVTSARSTEQLVIHAIEWSYCLDPSCSETNTSESSSDTAAFGLDWSKGLKGVVSSFLGTVLKRR